MSTALEDRLTAALHARAEHVQPENLRYPTLQPRTPTPTPTPTPAPRWRRPAVVALVAAAAAAAVALPIVLEDHHTIDRPASFDYHWPPSPDHPQPVQKLTDHLSGDMDGDGRPDQIRRSGRTVTVTLAADPAHPLTKSSADTGGLVGLVDLGGAGHAILVSTNDLVTGAEWQAIAVRHGALTLVLLREGADQGSIAVVPGYETSWLTPDGVAMTGKLDPVQQGERHLAVQVSRVGSRSGRPVISPVGRWCWDVVTQQVPAPCAPGTDNAFDPGPHGSLPALQPRVDINDTIDPLGTWQEGSTSLHLVEGPVHATSDFDQVYDVVGTIDGHDVSARAGVFNPLLYKTFVDLGHGVRGLVATSGPDPTWSILAFVDGKLVPLPVAAGPDGVRPGVQSIVHRGKGHPAQTWIGPDKQVFTSVQTGGVGQLQLVRWQVTDSSATKLEPVDLGRLCMDDFWGTYGTCTR